MNSKPHILFVPCILLLLMLIHSCENEISYNGGETTPKLTMNAFIYVDSLKNKLYLSMTGETTIQSVSNSVVEVRVNDELKETLNAIREEGTQLRTVEITTRFQPGDVVRIDAYTTDGEYHAWIQETVPHPVEIQQIDTSQVVVMPKPFYAYDKSLRVKVRFKDEVDKKNYYRIVLEQRHHVKGGSAGMPMSADLKDYTYWPWEDIALTDGRPATSEELNADIFERVTNIYGVFDDSWFQNNEYILNLQIPMRNRYYSSELGFVPQYLDLDLVVRLLSITEAEFYYLTTMNMIDSDILDDYINDPVKIPGNVHGGNGFVGISSEKGKMIRLVDNGEIQYADPYR
ncbi:DUF4249 domain-containing protein [Bacteroides sp. 51]|uniref:DUF4249 domain-containing protein n=1 Tax=Bacteroides sp. 51 TaxID=2302938 RepID=UPI0013D56BC6|nr:DUF4249 domain-containing protein [Bacteroides sp. 51]NDV84097.1 DUF4249 domain-containing protein [Bacteroides sp. 51]